MANTGNDRGTDTTVRASITFSAENYRVLESIAHAKKVSLAWVVRDAVDHYISDQWPLLQPTADHQS